MYVSLDLYVLLGNRQSHINPSWYALSARSVNPLRVVCVHVSVPLFLSKKKFMQVRVRRSLYLSMWSSQNETFDQAF